MNNTAIGIFDSGLGGLTALKAARELMPSENFIYFGDTGRNPYGSKTPAQLRIMARQDMDFLSSFGVGAIIAACGTVSSNAPEVLDAYPLPVVGVLRPAVKAAAELGGVGPVGIIATEASVKSGSFERALKKACPDRNVLSLACPEFVPLIESGHMAADDRTVQASVARTLAPLREAGISALVLGCTHYGLIAGAIREYLGRDIRLISASECAAREMYSLRGGNRSDGKGSLRLFTSGESAEFTRLAGLLLGTEVPEAESVPALEVFEK